MGAVRQAVLEFDDEVQAPWRPRLVTVSTAGGPAPSPLVMREPSRRNPSRVGACRPPVAVPLPEARRPASASISRSGGPRPGRAPVEGMPAVRPERTARRATGRRPSGLRLTRRGRRLAVVLALCGGVVLGSWLAPILSGGDGAFRLAGESSVVVEPGDTLWSIAASVAEREDVRSVVHRIQQLNGIEGSVVMPGQVLRLP